MPSSTVSPRIGRIDILVNNAAWLLAPFLEVASKGELALIRENFISVTLFIRTCVLHDNGGSIVNITSVEAHRAGPGFAIYSR